ncbi:reverse transcriptase domain-containing protein [Tanacetum coccineum]
MTNLTYMLSKFVNSNTASTSGSGKLPSNTITNPKVHLKGITTRSSVAYQGPTIPTTSSSPPKVVERETEVTKDTVPPTNNGSTKDVQPLVVQVQPHVPNSEPVVAPVNLHFEISFVDALILMPKFPSTLKSLIGNKEKLNEMARTLLHEHCSAVLLKKLPEKLGDPGKFLIPCDFPRIDECLTLADLGASINLMPLSVWKILSLPELTPTCMTLELADRSISQPIGIAEDVDIKVGKFQFPTDFVVVDFDADPRVPLILRRSFLKTGRALIDVYEGELTLRVGNEAITFNLDQTSRYSSNYNDNSVNRIDVIEMACEEYSQEVLGFFDEVDAFLALKVDPTSPEVDDSYYDPERDILLLEAFLNDDPSLPPPTQGNYLPEDLPPHLEYTFLEGDDKLPVIIAKDLSVEEKSALIKVLMLHKRSIAWKLSDIKGYFQIPIDPRDQEKTTFTCPYGTFAYCRMPYGLCNAPGTFQRNCLSRVDKMLKRCEDTNLCLNWEKSHFMVKEGIVLGHKISKNGIEVDKAKVDVIAKLPHPTTVKGVRSFLSHADFETLNKKLTEAPILIAPDWDLPFELMYDASDFAIGAVLGQHHEKHFRPIHYASKTMNEAESHYTTTEKEMLAMVYAFEKFRSYLILNKSIVYTDHSALKYLFAKKDSKARLLQWVLLLQEFKFKVIDTKGAENLAADHLS